MRETAVPPAELAWPEPPDPPGLLRGFLLIFRLSLRQILFSQRTLLFLLITALPVLLAVLATVMKDWLPSHTLNNPKLLYQALYTFFYTHVLLLLVPLLYAMGLVGDEIEGKTLTCLVTRPISKMTLLLAKLAAYQLVALLIVGLSLVASFGLLHFGEGLDGLLGSLRGLLQDLAVLAVGLLIYGAIFMLFGLALKRSLLAALLYAAWESVFAYVPGIFHKLTVLHYLQVHSRIASEKGWLLVLLREVTTPQRATWTLCGVLLVALVAAVAIFRYREYQFQEPV